MLCCQYKYRYMVQPQRVLVLPHPPTCSTTGKKYFFYCGQWLDKDHGTEKTLVASLTDPHLNLTTYSFTVHTSDIPGAGTDAKVLLNLVS